MTAKRFAAALGTMAVAGVLSTGVAHADVPPFDTPFLDINCLCAGLLPGPVITQAMAPGTIIAGNVDGNTGAAVEYFVMPTSALSITGMGDRAASDTGQPVAYGAYRGHPSFTTVPVQDPDDGSWLVSTFFISGNRVIVMYGAGTTADEAGAELATIGATLQVI